jgi:hypothetical protein
MTWLCLQSGFFQKSARIRGVLSNDEIFMPNIPECAREPGKIFFQINLIAASFRYEEHILKGILSFFKIGRRGICPKQNLTIQSDILRDNSEKF